MPSEHRKIDWSPEDRARHKAIREKFQRERPGPAQLTDDEYIGPISLGCYQAYYLLLLELKKAREAADLSLSDIEERCGIDKGALSRLENGLSGNPTIETLFRYATALGKEVHLTLEDRPAPKKRTTEAAAGS